MRRRILLTIVGVATFAVLAFFVPAAAAVRSRIQRSDLLELQREASIVASRITADGPIDLATISRMIDPDHDLALYGPDGRRLDGVGPPAADDIVSTGLDGVLAEGYVDGDLVAAVPVRLGPDGPGVVVRIREPRAASSRRVLESWLGLAAAAVGVIAVAAGVGALLARRLSRPVEELREQASSLGEGIPHPPPPPTGIAELDELGAAMTEAADRIQELLQRERSFSSHVSHQLRTPVAAMRVAIEAELHAPRSDATDVLHESLRALDRLESTITSMLALARHDEREPAWCDVTALVCEHVDRWAPSYAAAGRDLSAQGADVIGRVDPPALHHILDVLLDNALVHGRGVVLVTTSKWGDEITVEVRDDGPARVDADPFSERRTDSGHGIGLHLARTLAESEGGHLSLIDSAPTVFRLTLPATS